MNKSNQYGETMAKLLPTGSIEKEKSIPDWYKFNLLIEKMSPEDKIGHLFILNIDLKKAGKKELLFKEKYSLIFEKIKRLDPTERSVLKLLETMRQSDDSTLNAFKFNRKTHTTMSKKIFIPLCVEHIRFLIKRTG